MSDPKNIRNFFAAIAKAGENDTQDDPMEKCQDLTHYSPEIEKLIQDSVDAEDVHDLDTLEDYSEDEEWQAEYAEYLDSVSDETFD